MRLERKIEEMEAKLTTGLSVDNPLILQHTARTKVYEYVQRLMFVEGNPYVIKHLPSGKRTKANPTWERWIAEYEGWLEGMGEPLIPEVTFYSIEDDWAEGIEPLPSHLTRRA